MKRQQKNMVVLYVIAVFLFLLVVISLFMLWNGMTSRASGMIDCSVSRIDYAVVVNGSCALPFSEGNTSICALPRDIHCKGLIQDFPIVKAILEASNE